VRQGRLLPASWRAEKRERKRVGAPALSVNPTGPNPSPSSPSPLSLLPSVVAPATLRLACQGDECGARRFSRPMLRFWPARVRVYETAPDSTDDCVFGR
jgi:hypothetical protein